MSDLISRQAAIEEFIAEKDAWEYYGIDYHGKKYVKNLMMLFRLSRYCHPYGRRKEG